MATTKPFTITGLKSRGVPDDERVVLKANVDIEKGKVFLIYDTTYDEDGKLSNQYPHLYELVLQQAVKADEIVVIRTKAGKFRADTLGLSVKHHRYFWGLEETVWNKDKTEIVHVVPVSTAATSKNFPPEKKK
jgi:hypothetical protein